MALLLRATMRAGPLRRPQQFLRCGTAAGSRRFMKSSPVSNAAAAAEEAKEADPFAEPGSDTIAQQILTPWQKWFPYDPIPVIPQYAPYIVKLEQGKEYMWCSCGKSKTQPWNNMGAGCEPWCGTPYVPRTNGYKALCGCKHSHCKPLADFTGFWMWCDHNIIQGMTFMFGFCFVSSVYFSWIFHP